MQKINERRKELAHCWAAACSACGGWFGAETGLLPTCGLQLASDRPAQQQRAAFAPPGLGAELVGCLPSRGPWLGREQQ